MAKKKAKKAGKPAAKKTKKAPAKAKVVKGKSTGKKVAKVAKVAKRAAATVKKAVGKAAAAVGKSNVVPFASPKKSGGDSTLSKIVSPLDDRVIVELEGSSERTAGGLYIPETVEASDRPRQGKVVAVGRGHMDKKGRIRPLDVQLGDTVLFDRWAGSELTLGDKKLMVIRESQLLGIVRP